VLDDFPKGYTIHSNLGHSEPYVDGFICFCNDYFDVMKYRYRDVQLYELDVKMKDLNDEYINLNEIVDISTGDTVDILPEDFDPALHRFRYGLHLELMLEWYDS
jgi:hypothetical protein